jgi:hypothetical protein
MFNSTNSPFTIPVTPYDGNRSDGFGDGNGWWIILFVLFFLEEPLLCIETGT